MQIENSEDFQEWYKLLEYTSDKGVVDELVDSINQLRAELDRYKSDYMQKELTRKITELRAENEEYHLLISHLLNDLPTNRDWLDPAIENSLKELVRQRR